MHVLILGRTGTGKSTLLKMLAAQYKRSGVEPLIYTAIRGELDSYGQCYYEIEPFLARVFAEKKRPVFVDEAGEVVDRSHIARTAPLATRTRHLGHALHFSAQRAALIMPTARDQCERAYIFRVSSTDARDLSNEYGNAALLEACTLSKGEYFKIDWHGCEKRKLDLANIYKGGVP